MVACSVSAVNIFDIAIIVLLYPYDGLIAIEAQLVKKTHTQKSLGLTLCKF